MLDAATQHHIREQVILTGAVHWEHVHKLYAIADVFATASLSEVHPLTLIEAAMCGLPIVARRDESYSGLVVDGYNGYLVDTDQEIAARLSDILADETTRLAFSHNGLILSEGYTAESHVGKVESLYQQMIYCEQAKKLPVNP
jgi:1,2-diacylglycerol 3-alpha-glucosyltransferase